MLREISNLAKVQVSQIKQRRVDDQEDVGDKDYMGDFVSEEYLVKNIRVMPMGGATDNASEHTSKYYASAMGAGGAEGDFEENKHNQDVLL